MRNPHWCSNYQFFIINSSLNYLSLSGALSIKSMN